MKERGFENDFKENGSRKVQRGFQKKIWIFIVTFAVILVGGNAVCHIAYGKSLYGMLSSSESKTSVKKEKSPAFNTDGFQEYDQSYTLDGYTVALKSGMFSASTGDGRLVFEVSKKEGAVDEPTYSGGHTITRFGNREHGYAIHMLGSGTEQMDAEKAGDHLMIYFTFHMDDLDKRLPSESLVYLSHDGEKYPFDIIDNESGMVYLADKDTRVQISSFAVSVISSKSQTPLKIEVEKKDGEREILLEIENDALDQTDSRNYGVYVSEGQDGEKTYCYKRKFSKSYPTEQIRELYLNGVKLEEKEDKVTTDVKNKKNNVISTDTVQESTVPKDDTYKKSEEESRIEYAVEYAEANYFREEVEKIIFYMEGKEYDIAPDTEIGQEILFMTKQRYINTGEPPFVDNKLKNQILDSKEYGKALEIIFKNSAHGTFEGGKLNDFQNVMIHYQPWFYPLTEKESEYFIPLPNQECIFSNLGDAKELLLYLEENVVQDKKR